MVNKCLFQEKCELRHPPANEIYRKDNLSVFEVDGQVSSESDWECGREGSFCWGYSGKREYGKG